MDWALTLVVVQWWRGEAALTTAVGNEASGLD